VIAYRATACPEAGTMPTPCRNRPSRCSPSSSRWTGFPRSVRSVLNSTSASRAHNGYAGTSPHSTPPEHTARVTAVTRGTLLAVRGVGAIAVGAAAAMALRRTGYRMPLVAGFVVAAIGTAAMAIAPRMGLSPYVWLSPGAGHHRPRQQHG